MDEALQGGLPDRKYAKELLKRIREQYRKGDSTYRDSDFQLRTLLKPFGLNEAQTNSIVSNTLGTSYNVDTLTTGREGGLLNALGAYVPVDPVDYLSQVVKGVPEQLQNFGPQVEKSLAGIGLSMSEADPDPAYMAQRQPELDRTSDSRLLQNTLSLLPGTPNNADAFRESARNIENYISTNFDTLKNKLQSFGGMVQSWAEENIPTFELPGYDPESAQLAQERQERRDNLADPQFRRQQLQQIYDRASKEIEANPLPFASTAFERGAASLGGSVPSYATMALAPFDPIKLPTILLSNAVAGRMVAGEAVEGIAQDDVWLEMSQNMTDAQKQEALSYINPIVNFEAYNTRTAAELAAAGADALSMLPIGGLPTRLGLDLMGGGASELIDFDLAGRARRRGLRAYAQKMNLPIKDDPRLQLVNRGDYAKAYPAQAQEAFQTGIVMSGAASTPTTLVDALFTNYRNRQPQGNPNQNPGQIQALTNVVLNKLKTLNKKDPKQVQSYLENPITEDVVRNIQAKSDSGQALTKEETEIAKRHNEIDTPILEAPEATPTDTATDALAEGVAREGEYYRRLQENAARTAEKTPDDSNSKILQSAGRQKTEQPTLPGFKPLRETNQEQAAKSSRQLQDREAKIKEQEQSLRDVYDDEILRRMGIEPTPTPAATRPVSEQPDMLEIQARKDAEIKRQAETLSANLADIRSRIEFEQAGPSVVAQVDAEIAQAEEKAIQLQEQADTLAENLRGLKGRMQFEEDAPLGQIDEQILKSQETQRQADTLAENIKVLKGRLQLETDATPVAQVEAEIAEDEAIQQQIEEVAAADDQLRQEVAFDLQTQEDQASEQQIFDDNQRQATTLAENLSGIRNRIERDERIVQEISEMETQERIAEDQATQDVIDQDSRNRFNKFLVDLTRTRDQQNQRQTEERVQAIFGDLETSERSTVAGGATINPNTPRGAQILKQRELEVLRDAMVAEFPGTSQVDVVETVEQAREMLPEGTELADDTEGIAFRDAEGNPRIVLVGNNIENKQVIEGQTGNALENAVRDGVRIFFHESLGHDGLRQAFGGNEDALNNFMTRLYEARGDEINDWGSRRYSEGDWSKMNDSVKAEEWLVQNFTEEGIAPSGILDSIRVLFGSEFNDASIRKQMNAVQNALRKGRKPKFTLRTPQGARANVGEEIPVEEMEIEIPGQNEQAAPEAAPQEQSQGPTTTPIEPDPALDSLIRSLYEKGISPPSKSMITARKKKFFMEFPFLKGADLNSVDVGLIQARIKAAQDEIDSIINPVNLEMINNPATRRARKLTAAQRNKVRGLLADIQTMQEILGSAPVAPIAQTDQATSEATPEAAPVQDTTESTSTDVQPIAEEAPQEVADTGPAIRMSAGRPSLQEVKQLEAERKAAPGYQTPRQQQESSTAREELAAEARRYIAGEIEYEDFQAAVQRLNPIESLGIKYDIPGGVPAPATTEEIQDAVGIKSQGKVLGVDTEIADGTDVGLRLDINAYQNKDVWVPTIHDGSVKGTQGKVLAYAPVARVLGHSSDGKVSFESNPDAALNIASGKINKTTIARVFGSFQNANPEELFNQAQEYLANPKQGNDVWVEVGMDPTRGSFFYDKANGDPVLTADEVIQVGALVVAKNPEYGNVNNIRTVGRTKGIPAGLRFSSGRRPVRGQVVTDRTVLDPAALKMIDNQDLQDALQDEGMFLFMWDRMRADGEYVTPGGKRFKLQGGPMNPHMTENRAAGVIGASTPEFEGAIQSAVARSNGYGVPVLMGEDAHTSNLTFFDIYTALLQESFDANPGMKEDVVKDFAKTYKAQIKAGNLSPGQNMKKEKDISEAEAGKNALLKSVLETEPSQMLDAYIKAAPDLTFEARRRGLVALGAPDTAKKLGTPNIKELADQLTDPEYVGVPAGSATSIVKFNKLDPTTTDVAGMGVAGHRSYGMLFKGDLIGKFRAPVPLDTMLGSGKKDLKSNTVLNNNIEAKVNALKKQLFRSNLPESLQQKFDKILTMDDARIEPEPVNKTIKRLKEMGSLTDADRSAITTAEKGLRKQSKEQNLSSPSIGPLKKYKSGNLGVIQEALDDTPALDPRDIIGKVRSTMPPVNDPAGLRAVGRTPSPGPAFADLEPFIGDYTQFKNSRHIRAYVDAVNGTFMTPTAETFAAAFDKAEAAKVGALTPYSAETLSRVGRSKVKPPMRLYQLGGRKLLTDKGTEGRNLSADQFDIFFALHDHGREKDKNSKPWYVEFGFVDEEIVGKNAVELVSVMNNEPDLLSGVGTGAILLKAIEEGATVLDAFAVKSKSKPNGLLPTLYARYGFETVGVVPFDRKIWAADQAERLGVGVRSKKIKDLFEGLKDFWRQQGWDEADGNPDVVVMKWTGRREDGTTLDRDTIRQEVVKPLRADDDEGTVLGVLPSPPELNNERNTGDSENQVTGGDNPEGGRGDAEDGGTDARSGSTLARSVLKPDSFQKGVQAVRDLDPQVYEATGAPTLRFSSGRLSKADRAAEDFSQITLVPNDVLRNMLGAYPEYMNGVVQHMRNLRTKWQSGQMKPRDVAKAYWITIASIGSAATKFDNAQAYFDTTIPDAFASYNKRGAKMMRPEEFAAFWFTTPIGQRALDAIDQGRVDKDAFDDLVAKRQRAFGRFDMTKPDGRYFPKPLTAGTRQVQGIDPRTNKPKQQNVPITPFGATIPSPNLDRSRPGVMSDIDPTGDLFSESLGRPKEGAYGVRDMYEIAQRINQKPGDKAVLKEELGKLTGIGEFGKLPFISHFFGVGDAITMDARELNFWTTGEVDTSRLTRAKNNGTATPDELQKLEALKKIKANDDMKRLLNAEILNRMQELQNQGVIPADLTVDDLGEVGHHWIWDASEGDETTHEGTYLTMTRFSSGRRRPLQNNPGGRAKKEFGALKALRQLDHFFDHKSNLPEREAYELLTQKARGEMTNYIEIGHELGNIFLKAKENEQAAIYNYLTERNANANLIPDRQVRGSNKTLRQAAVQAKQDIIQIGEDLVRLGMLDPDAYANRKGKYLPRVYLKYLFNEDHQKILSTGGSLKMSDLGYLKKRKDVDALVRNLVLGEIKSPGYLVSKTLMQSGQDIARMQFLKDLSGNQEWVLPESYVNISYANEIEGILQANPALRQQLLNEGLPPAARQTALRRVTPEYLAAEARRLREQVLPSKKDGSAQKELVRRMIEVLDQKVSQARTNQDYDPENYTQLPDTSRYGDLRGAIVRNEIYDDLVGSQELFTQSGMERGLNYLTSLMKWGLTAANPAVWANNLRSNTAMMHFAGLPFHRSFDYRFRALKQMLTNGSRYQAFKEQGLTLSTFAADELGRMETRLAQSLSAEDKKIIGQPLRYSLPVLTAERLGSLIYNAFGDFYQGMEVMDKLALGMYLEDHGPSLGAPFANNRKMTTEAAMREANKALFDYTDVPDWLRRSRRSLLGAPFLTWTYKAAPYLTKMAGDPKKLLRAATWYGGLYTLMAMREAELDDEENDAYYNGLQDWLAKRQLFSIPLPQKDENGMVQTEDYTMFAPHAFLMNAAADILPGGRFSALDVAKDLGFASHPLLESTMELVFNKDSFTGQEIYRSTDTSTQMADKIREHYMDNLLPQFIAPNGWTARMIELSSDNPNVFGPSSVLDRQGNPTRTLGQQAQRVVPFMPNVYPSDLRKGLKYGRQDILRSIQALTKEYSVNRRKYRGDKEALAKLKTEYDAERARLQELLREFPTAGQLPRFEEYAE